MEPLSREERKKIFKDELSLLKESQKISPKVHDYVAKAHDWFYEELDMRENRIKQVEAETKVPQYEPVKIQKPKREKPVKTEEQIRERNITWLLNLGVILLLIGGLYVATSNWETMSNLTKAGSIGLISLVFYGMAYVSKRVLRIDKTAFAFIVLGSLFLPIFLLSIGWFELIGPYLSVSGEGRHLFGLLSSFLVLPVYVYLAKKLSARLFVWFSYISLFVGMGFLLASLQAGEDTFFLGMMLFQAGLIYVFHRVKAVEKFQLFTKEFVHFAQLNLILTSVLMLFLFDSNAYFGFNLILTACIYLAMVYVTGKKNFHFVFTAMLVFGVFQLVEHSFLDSLNVLIYAMIGFVFLLLPKALDDDYPWKRIFTLTSGVISGLAFLLITFDAILIKLGDPTIVLLLAYFVIAGNFLYLSHTTKKGLFRYLTAIFISVALFEGYLLVNELVTLKPIVLFVSLIGFLMFIAGSFMRGKWFEPIKQPARDVGWFYMGVTFYGAAFMYAWWELGVILLFISFCAYVSLEKETRKAFHSLALWLIPLALGFGIVSFSEEIRLISDVYRTEIGVTGHFVLGSLVLLLARLITKKETLSKYHFYVSQGLYTIALLCALAFPTNEVWLRPLIFIGGIGMYLWLYQQSKEKLVAYFVSITTLIAYFTVLSAMDGFGKLEFVVGAVVLFVATISLKNKDLAKAFASIGHIYLPFALLLTLFSYGNGSVWAFALAFIIYGVSTVKAKVEWQKKTFLYSAFTALFAVFATSLTYVETVAGEFSYLLTSGVMAGFWFLATPLYKRRTLYYFVPFSLFGVLTFIMSYPFGAMEYTVSLLYAIGVMVILHLAKWTVMTAIPTLLIYGATLQYLMYHSFPAAGELLLIAVFGVVFLFAGKWFYKSLYEKPLSIDVYTIAGMLFFFTMYAFPQPLLWMKILPGLLLAGAIWMQRARVKETSRWIPTFLAGGYLLQPYYTLLNNLEIHELLLREVYVLPFIIVGVYLQICLKGRFEKLTNRLQWGILFFVALVLVVDGLETSTIYDALILGSLSLASILVGVFLKVKSYFFIGTGVLLLNVFMQTRPFWGNLPWWAYLLIAGTILIGVASSNEWNKQKSQRGEETIVGTLKEKARELWKQWK